MLTLGFMFLRYYRIYVVCLVLELLGSWVVVGFLGSWVVVGFCFLNMESSLKSKVLCTSLFFHRS